MQSVETLNINNTNPVAGLDISQLEIIRSDYLRDLEKLRKKYAAKLVKLTTTQSSAYYFNQ